MSRRSGEARLLREALAIEAEDAQAAGALDLYLWLTYRNSYLRRPTRVPWALLALQLGAEYRDQRDFKRKVLRSLRRVLVVYPTARVQQVRGGLRLRPAPCHVRRSAILTS